MDPIVSSNFKFVITSINLMNCNRFFQGCYQINEMKNKLLYFFSVFAGFPVLKQNAQRSSENEISNFRCPKCKNACGIGVRDKR